MLITLTFVLPEPFSLQSIEYCECMFLYFTHGFDSFYDCCYTTYLHINFIVLVIYRSENVSNVTVMKTFLKCNA